jgi:hypothetical protein
MRKVYCKVLCHFDAKCHRKSDIHRVAAETDIGITSEIADIEIYGAVIEKPVGDEHFSEGDNHFHATVDTVISMDEGIEVSEILDGADIIVNCPLRGVHINNVESFDYEVTDSK